MKHIRSFKLFENDDSSYRGSHTAPTKNDAPLYDLTLNKVYPNDIYSRFAARYYGDGTTLDDVSIGIIHSAHNNPTMQIKIYRAVPDLSYDNRNLIREYNSLLRYYKEYQFFPMPKRNKRGHEIVYSIRKEHNFDIDDSEICDVLRYAISDLSSKLHSVKINPGDWVTINQTYAINHGKAMFDNYLILTKTVQARNIFNDGNSIHEWGYWP